MERDDFYVGYLPEAPPALGRFLRLVVAALLLLVVAVGGLLASRQSAFDPGVFEFGEVRSFEGTVRSEPHPALEIEGPGGDVARLHLVAVGKHGAHAETAGLDGRRARLDGTLIYREGETMIEVVPGTVTALDGAGPGALREAARVEDLGVRELHGEIVDSKCHLGVMKPGRGKPHRACAALCLWGGVPPILLLEDEAADRRHVLLAGPDGGPWAVPTLELVAIPVVVRGHLERAGDDLRLRVEDVSARDVG